MSVVKRVVGLLIQYGGEEHSGWLPAGAARPLPTPIENVILDVEIQADPGGFLLCWTARDGKRSGDYWFPTLAEAEHAAFEDFGIEAAHWQCA